MEFVKFTEVNDHEGETWNFWLQVDGNEEALAHLRTLVDEDQYSLARYSRPEHEVDVLVEEADCGYDYAHQKVVGKLGGLPESIDWEDWESLDDVFYKGRIAGFFK